MIRLVLTQKFPKNYYFLPPDTYVCVSVNNKYKFFGKFGVSTIWIIP